MKSLVAALVFGLAFTAGAQGDDPKGKEAPKTVGAVLISADGLELGQELTKDAKAAKERYTPKQAPKGVMGGSVVNLHGVIAYSTRDGICLASGSAWMILVDGKVTGAGPYVTIGVESVSLASDGSKLALVRGAITRSDKPFGK